MESDFKTLNVHVFGAHHSKSGLQTIILENLGHLIPPNLKVSYIKDNLDEDKLALVEGADVLICTVRDKLNSEVLEQVAKRGVKLIMMRALNCRHLDLDAAKKFGLQISFCPYYTPEAIAEHVFALLLSVNRKVHKAYNRVREDNFELDGLLGTDLHGKTMGLVGFGKIGRIVARIALGFGMKVLAFDKTEKNPEKLAVEFNTLENVLSRSDVISLHLSENPETIHIINENTIGLMKEDAFLINTARGTLIKSDDLLNALLKGKFSGVGLDVYEDKYEVFFRNLEGQTLMDETLARLLTIPKVLITCRLGAWTKENIIMMFETIFKDLKAFCETGKVINSLF